MNDTAKTDIFREIKVDSFNIEFGYELISVIPYAYWLETKGLLKETRSGSGSEALYYFSPKHTINPEPRSWDNMRKFWKSYLPNQRIHNHTLELSRFKVPPYKQQYAHVLPKFEKPVVCICNRYNYEWGKPPINYFSVECLDALFELLKEKYQVIYWSVDLPKKLQDGAKPLKLNDRELISKKHPEVIIFQDFLDGRDWNTILLGIFAQSSRFITMNGGYSILASYFGGTNIVYSKECREITEGVNSFYQWYNVFAGSRIVHTDTYEDLIRKVKKIFVDEKPTVNILTRTCNRPNFFKDCHASITNQSYKNTVHVVGYHDDESRKYLIDYKIYPIKYPEYTTKIPMVFDDHTYGAPFPSNYYVNHLIEAAKDGWVVWLDDDDQFAGPDSLKTIMEAVESENDLILWTVKIGDVEIPSKKNFGKFPVCRDISGIGYACHIKHLRGYHAEPYKRIDYRMMAMLYKKLNPVWINQVLTCRQATGEGAGMRKDKQKPIKQKI